MDVADLEHFLVLVERGNFSSAAKDLGLSQPALSRQIQRLERAVGAPLFLRSRAGVQLAPAGERFRSYAEEGVALYRRLLNDLRGGETPLKGELRLAASTTPAEFLVPRLLAEFTAAYPGVRAIVFTANSQRVVEEVAEGRRDLGLVGARFPRRGLHFDPIAEDEVVLAVPFHHPLARFSEVPIDALAKQAFIEREDGSGTTLSVRRALAKQGMALPPYRVVMTLSTTQAIVSAVRAGYGMGFVSSLALGDAGTDGPVAVRLVGVPLRRAIYLVRDARHLPPPAGQRFVDFIVRKSPSPLAGESLP